QKGRFRIQYQAARSRCCRRIEDAEHAGYLVSDEAFGDFELLIDARPDWAVDTGVLVRTTPAGNVGYQILIDHRKGGGIGGFHGNGLAGFHAMPYAFTAIYDDQGRPID